MPRYPAEVSRTNSSRAGSLKDELKKSPGKNSTLFRGLGPWSERPVVHYEQGRKHKMQRVVLAESTKNLLREELDDPPGETKNDNNVRDFFENILADH
jgi:hypothetical protein